jgi:C-terminal processing protease CtpA/Prc
MLFMRCLLRTVLIISLAPTIGWAQPTPGTNAPETPVASPAPPPLRDLVNRLSQRDLQEVIGQLRSNYVDPKALTTQEINQAAVEGLLSRLGPGASLQPRADAEKATAEAPFKSEIILEKYGYLRLGTLNKETISKLDSSLTDLNAKSVAGLIIDLRTTPLSSDYDLASEVLNRLIPKGAVLFKLLQPKTNQERAFTSSADPAYRGPLAVLVDEDTAGAAEAIAGVLKAKDKALIFGQKTSGKAVEYQKYLVGNDLVLTVAVSELVIPDGPAIFPDGLPPDIAVVFSKDEQDKVLLATAQQAIEPYVVDEERPRTNEAALVAGLTPELDAAQTLAKNASQPTKPKDFVLQRAVDFLTTVGVYRR